MASMRPVSIYGNHIFVILLSLLAAFYIFNTSSKLSILQTSEGDDGVVTVNASTLSLGASNSNASSILTDLTGHVASGDETKNPPPKKNTNLCSIQDLKNGTTKCLQSHSFPAAPIKHSIITYGNQVLYIRQF